MAHRDDATLGEFIRHQRELQELSLRQMASLAGISNPYLSQIERGLREPSKRVLDAIAQTLHVSAEALDQHARRQADASDPAAGAPAVVTAIMGDPRLTSAQREALLQVYAAFTEASAGPE